MEFGLSEILTIIDKVKSTDLSMFEYQDADTRIRIRGTKKKTAAGRAAGRPVPCAAPEPSADRTAAENMQQEAAQQDDTQREDAAEGCIVTSPMVGTFYAAASEKEEPFIHVGDRVEKGQTVGIVEAMKLMNEIESEWDGTVAEIYVKNGQMVEYGQPLVRIVQER